MVLLARCLRHFSTRRAPCTSPAGNYMSSKEQNCMDNCARRFLESTQFVVKYFQAKANASSHSDF